MLTAEITDKSSWNWKVAAVVEEETQFKIQL